MSPASYPPSYSIRLTRPYLGSGRSVRSRDRVVDVDQNTGVSRLVSAGEADERAGRAAAAASNLDLSAGDVELSTAGGASRVQRNVLDTEEIFTRGQALGDGDGDLALACAICVSGDRSMRILPQHTIRGPAESASGDHGTLLEDLEPYVATAVPGCGSLSARNLGHVELKGTGMADRGHGSESDGRACGNFVGAARCTSTR